MMLIADKDLTTICKAKKKDSGRGQKEGRVDRKEGRTEGREYGREGNMFKSS